MVRQAPVICVMAPPIHLGAWSMAVMLWLLFELLLFLCSTMHTFGHAEIHQARQGILKQGSNKHRHTKGNAMTIEKQTAQATCQLYSYVTALGSLQLAEIGVHRHVC